MIHPTNQFRLVQIEMFHIVQSQMTLFGCNAMNNLSPWFLSSEKGQFVVRHTLWHLLWSLRICCWTILNLPWSFVKNALALKISKFFGGWPHSFTFSFKMHSDQGHKKPKLLVWQWTQQHWNKWSMTFCHRGLTQMQHWLLTKCWRNAVMNLCGMWFNLVGNQSFTSTNENDVEDFLTHVFVWPRIVHHCHCFFALFFLHSFPFTKCLDIVALCLCLFCCFCGWMIVVIQKLVIKIISFSGTKCRTQDSGIKCRTQDSSDIDWCPSKTILINTLHSPEVKTNGHWNGKCVNWKNDFLLCVQSTVVWSPLCEVWKESTVFDGWNWGHFLFRWWTCCVVIGFVQLIDHARQLFAAHVLNPMCQWKMFKFSKLFTHLKTHCTPLALVCQVVFFAHTWVKVGGVPFWNVHWMVKMKMGLVTNDAPLVDCWKCVQASSHTHQSQTPMVSMATLVNNCFLSMLWFGCTFLDVFGPQNGNFWNSLGIFIFQNDKIIHGRSPLENAWSDFSEGWHKEEEFALSLMEKNGNENNHHFTWKQMATWDFFTCFHVMLCLHHQSTNVVSINHFAVLMFAPFNHSSFSLCEKAHWIVVMSLKQDWWHTSDSQDQPVHDTLSHDDNFWVQSCTIAFQRGVIMTTTTKSGSWTSSNKCTRWNWDGDLAISLFSHKKTNVTVLGWSVPVWPWSVDIVASTICLWWWKEFGSGQHNWVLSSANESLSIEQCKATLKISFLMVTSPNIVAQRKRISRDSVRDVHQLSSFWHAKSQNSAHQKQQWCHGYPVFVMSCTPSLV